MRQLILVGKYWHGEFVKTRLAQAIGSTGACQFQEAAMRTLVERFSALGDCRWWALTPAEALCDAVNWTVRWGPTWKILVQRRGDLGQRLDDLFRLAFHSGASRVVMLGVDSPTVPVETIERAWRELQHHDAVFGPAEDGGYYLVGLARPWPELFSGIDWGSSAVWEQTLARLAAKPARRWLELPRGYDVDRIEDLRTLAAELNAMSPESLAPFMYLQQVVCNLLSTLP